MTSNNSINKEQFAKYFCSNIHSSFGSRLPGRYFTSGTGYRYGFGGQIKDDEVKGSGNTLEYRFRVYDSRLGKFQSTDPLEDEYCWQSPYNFAENSPIILIELEGKEGLAGALVGGGFEYLGQVSGNLLKAKLEGNSLLSWKTIQKATYSDVDFLDVGVSAGAGFLMPNLGAVNRGYKVAKILVTSEVLKGFLNYKPIEKFTMSKPNDAL